MLLPFLFYGILSLYILLHSFAESGRTIFRPLDTIPANLSWQPVPSARYDKDKPAATAACRPGRQNRSTPLAKEKTCYVCASCGYETARWLGCCPDCGEWNTFEERKTVSPISVASKTAEKAARYQTTQKTEPIPLSKVQERSMPRSSTGNEELDRVLGGGLVPGSAILIGGDPGIGKSTLLLQVAGSLSQQCRVLYVSGEESAHQIKMRASRIGVPQDTLYVLTENDVESALEKCGRLQPDVLIIDSIQTMVSQDSASAPGSVSQVRQSGAHGGRGALL